MKKIVVYRHVGAPPQPNKQAIYVICFINMFDDCALDIHCIFIELSFSGVVLKSKQSSANCKNDENVSSAWPT